MSVISIDPGDSTGVAVWSDEGQLVRKWKCSLEDFIDWADGVDFTVSTVVVEDYVQDPYRKLNRKGSKMKASQALGVSKALAKRLGAKLVIQKNTILTVTAMHAGVRVVSHFPDDISAYLHGYYFFETKGIRLPALQEALKVR